MKINIDSKIGNSPKMTILKDLTIAFSSYDIDKAMSYMAEDVVWTLVGEKPIKGRDAFAGALAKMSHIKVVELTIDGILTHGREAAVHGEMKMSDGSVFGFSDFYVFTSAGCKVASDITSYVVKK